MDNKFYVPQETARRLKEAGYPGEQDAPITYHEALSWLENNLGTEIYLTYARGGDMFFCNIKCSDGECWYDIDTISYITKQAALNAAILKVLELECLQQKQQQ